MKKIFRLSTLLLLILMCARSSAKGFIDQQSSAFFGCTDDSFQLMQPSVTGENESENPTAWRHNFALLDLSKQEPERESGEAHGGANNLNWHRIFGFSTLASALMTIVTGFATPDELHHGFAVLSSTIGIITCANGYYQYHSALSLTDGDIGYTAHALLGTVATTGFVATLAIAHHKGGDKVHVVVGGISGVAFSITLGILYF